jgi:hypothetical protein
MESFMRNVAMNEFFAEERNRRIYECMEKVYLRHVTIDLTLLMQELQARDMLESVGGMMYLDRLVHPKIPDWLWYKSEWQEHLQDCRAFDEIPRGPEGEEAYRKLWNKIAERE